MTATAHAAIGVTIAALVNNPALGIPLAFASHIICDIIPHWDSGMHKDKKSLKRLTVESTIDVLCSACITIFLLLFVFTEVNFIYGVTMAFTAQLLDWLTIPYLYLKITSAPFKWVYQFQDLINTRLDKPWGIATQISVVLLLIVIAKL